MMGKKAKRMPTTGSPPSSSTPRLSTAQIRESVKFRNSRMYKLTNFMKCNISQCYECLQHLWEIGYFYLFMKSLISTLAFSLGLLFAIFYMLKVDDTFSKHKEIWILIPILFDLARNLLTTLLGRIRMLIDRELFTSKTQLREFFIANSILLLLQTVVGSLISAAIAIFLYYSVDSIDDNRSKTALVLYAASIVTTVVVVLFFGLFIMIVKLFGGRRDTELVTNLVIGMGMPPLVIILLHQLVEHFTHFIDAHGHILPIMIMSTIFIGWNLWEKVAYSPLTSSAVWNGSLHLIMATLMSSVTSSIYEKGQRGPEKYLFIYQLLMSGVTMSLMNIYAHQTIRISLPLEARASTRASNQLRLQHETMLCSVLGAVSLLVHSVNFALLHQFEWFEWYRFNFNLSFLFIFYLPVSLAVLMALITFSHILLDNLARSRPEDPEQVAIPYVTVLSDSIGAFFAYIGYHFYVTR